MSHLAAVITLDVFVRRWSASLLAIALPAFVASVIALAEASRLQHMGGTLGVIRAPLVRKKKCDSPVLWVLREPQTKNWLRTQGENMVSDQVKFTN